MFAFIFDFLFYARIAFCTFLYINLSFFFLCGRLYTVAPCSVEFPFFYIFFLLMHILVLFVVFLSAGQP